MRSLELKVPPPVVVVLLALGMYFRSKALPAAHLALPAHTYSQSQSVLQVSPSTSRDCWISVATGQPSIPCSRSVRRNWVRDGVFRWTRNPMYLGMVLVLVGWALQLSNAAAFAGPLLLFAWLTRFQIVPEERALRQNFGKEFSAYSQVVRRWL